MLGTRKNNGAKGARQRDIPDDADEKCVTQVHSKAKHEILRRYLGAWLAILGRGGAGDGGINSSSLTALPDAAGIERRARVAEDHVRAGRPGGRGWSRQEGLVRCAELNPTNYAHLSEVSAALKHKRVKIQPRQQEFLSLGKTLAEWSEREASPPPTFVFVDPYGVRGVPLELLARLLKIDRLEVLLTFMVRDPAASSWRRTTRSR